MATGGRRRLAVAGLLLALPAVTGCDVVEGAGWGAAHHGYLPLTADNFAEVTTQAMVAHSTFHMEMDVGSETMSLDARYSGDDDFDMDGTFDDGTSVSTVIIVGGEVYVRDKGDRVFYLFPDYLADRVTAEMDMGNPRQMAETFGAGIESLVYAGAHEVDYGMSHRYDLTMSRSALAEEMDIPEAAVPDVSYTIWLDSQHLMRRMVVWAFGTEVAVDIDRWGEPVTIEAPPADEVEPLPQPTDDT